jgi:hypothetical protein
MQDSSGKETVEVNLKALSAKEEDQKSRSGLS